MSKLIKSFALVSAFSFITRGIGFVARIILTRNLLTYDLGLYQSALSLFHVFLALATSGLPLAVSRFFANGKIKGTLSSALLLAIILSAIGISLPIVFRSTFLKVFSDPISLNLFYYLLPVLPLTAVYSLLRGALLGKEMFFHYSFT
ncbi:MAG: oligosaccharide flippase family protein, partial [Clostridia bacterium]|nr:oligosaccharide flippase family protein [Clostridia bacterium]